MRAGSGQMVGQAGGGVVWAGSELPRVWLWVELGAVTAGLSPEARPSIGEPLRDLYREQLRLLYQLSLGTH